MQSHMPQSIDNQKVNRIFAALKKDYALIGARHIKAWHAWLIVGIFAGAIGATALIVNRSGEFEAGQAFEEVDETAEAQEEIFEAAGTSSPWRLAMIDLKPIPEYGATIHSTHPTGQMFNLVVLFITDTPETTTFIPRIQVVVSKSSANKKKAFGTIKLLCERKGQAQTIVCRDGVWNAINTPMGTQVYTTKISGRDSNNGVISLSQDFTLSFRAVDPGLCKELIPGHNNPHQNRANVIFVGAGYESKKEPAALVAHIAKTVVDFTGRNLGLFSVEPFKSSKDKFNLWYIDKIIPGAICLGNCPSSEIMSLAENCPYGNKYVVNFANGGSTQVGDRIMFFSAFMPIVFDQLVGPFVHESGHLFGRLADEYVLFPTKRHEDVTSSSIFANHKNCYAGPQHNQQECVEQAPWKALWGNGCGKKGVIDCTPEDPAYPLEVGCFEGCLKDGLGIFRPTRNSVMSSIGGEAYPFGPFGPWNEKLIRDELNKIK